MNKYEIRVFGMKHSGLHAIINWIASLFEEPVYFFNNCGYHCDPYRTARGRGTHIEGLYAPLKRMRHWPEEKIEPFRQVKGKCLICCYENIFIPNISVKSSALDPERTVGASEQTFDVLIIRDLLNWGASTFKFKGRGLHVDGYNPAPDGLDYRDWKRREKHLGKWKSCAREFLGYTNYLREKKVCISYNSWLRKEHREHLADMFGRPNNEMTIETVALGRKGSMFGDGVTHQGKASEMKVLERWRHFEGNESFWEIFDRESLMLSAMIFH